MKRLILLTMMIAMISGNAISQSPDEATTPILLNKATLQKKADKSDEAIADEKNGAKSKTWISRAKLFQDIDNLGLEQASLGMDKTTLKLFYNEPLSSETSDNVENWTYESIKYIFEDGRLRGWTRVDPISETPLDEAFKSFKKAVELTEAEKQPKLEVKVKKDIDELKEQYLRHGLNAYYLKDFLGALKSFESILAVNEAFSVYDGFVDTTMINYCGITARDLAVLYTKEKKMDKAKEMYKKSIAYYTRLADFGFGGSTAYRQMTGDYYMLGDTLGAVKNLKKGIEQYPDSTVLISLAAQAYYQLRDNEGGLEFLEERLDYNPETAVVYYWKGLFITNHENVEEETIKQALALYDSSLLYDATDGNVWYQAGYVNYAVGANYFEQEGYEEDKEFRAELNAKGHEYYEAAIEKLEKTFEVSEGNYLLRKESLDLLKRIYYKLYGGEDERYLSVTKRLNAL
jgi:tetratricopeptide (TPR) repeat protein